jgi:hypothetical protein
MALNFEPSAAHINLLNILPTRPNSSVPEPGVIPLVNTNIRALLYKGKK